jgi:putative ABC transport system substrate-binding protein
MVEIKRRAFLAAVGGAAALGSLRANAQPRVRTVAVLLGSPDHADWRRLLDTFTQSLSELGWTDGRNIRLDVRWSGGTAQGNMKQARELVGMRPDVIFAAPSNAVIAVQRETKTIPIIFANVSDPVAQGIVDNLARPTGNLTGFGNLEHSLIGKWLQILKEAAPGLKRAALMIGTVNAASPIWYRRFAEVAPTLGVEPVSAPVNAPGEIEGVIKSLAAERNGALIVAGDTMMSDPAVRKTVIELAAAHRLPALYGELPFAEGGGLIAYGIDRTEPFRNAASYVDRILKGEKPSDLPVQQPTKFHFVVNLKTARALGLELSPALVATAESVIE